MRTDNIAVAIRTVVQDMGRPPRKLNQGCCYEVAESALDYLSAECRGKCRIVSTRQMAPFERPDGHNHWWITDGARHYDAERPGGVSYWGSLPFFRRIRKKSRDESASLPAK